VCGCAAIAGVKTRMSDFEIERLAAEHLPQVMWIEGVVFPAPWSEAMFVQEVEETWLSRSFVGVVAGRVVAYLIAWLMRDEVHILNLAVDPAYHRRGYARRLMEHMLAVAREAGCRMVTLEVRMSNDPARMLYLSMGFAPVGIRRRYYHDNNEDALVMTRRMESA
jgi:ribosomal-protein-alanine N-acetyltransferase